MELIETLESGCDVVVTCPVDDAWVVQTARALAGAPGGALGSGPVVVVGGGLVRVRRLESALRAGLTRVHAVRAGAAPIRDSFPVPDDIDVLLIEQRWLPLLRLAPARAWLMLDDVVCTGAAGAALTSARQLAPTVTLATGFDTLARLELYRPTFVDVSSGGADAKADPLPPPGRKVPVRRVSQRSEEDATSDAGRQLARAADQAAIAAAERDIAPMRAADALAFEALRKWRAEKARLCGVPAYRVLTNRQMQALIALHPRSKEEFLSVAGIGERTWEQYGKDFLEQLASAH